MKNVKKIKFKLLIISAILLLVACKEQKTETEISVIPKPVKQEQLDVVFKLKENTTISLVSTGENENEIASYLKARIKK